MIKWTTPTLKCNIPEGLEFDYILLTLKQGKIVIEKMIEKESVIDNAFSVFFSQDETSLFAESIIINAQLNIMFGNTRQATNIVDLKITKNLHDEEIDDIEIKTLEITENGTYSVNGYDKVVVNVAPPTPEEQLLFSALTNDIPVGQESALGTHYEGQETYIDLDTILYEDTSMFKVYINDVERDINDFIILSRAEGIFRINTTHGWIVRYPNVVATSQPNTKVELYKYNRG